ncbi:MAG: PqqD family protein [Ruminococcaceae bacterium]|nr:PqqD family protein [Oscillospiraceae bacterium]
MRKKKVIEKNFLDKIPSHKEGLGFSTDSDGNVTLEMENKGIVNKIAQKLIKKPKTSYIHLEEFGSFIWPLIDGEKSIYEIGEEVEAHFGEKAHPLYERLATYFQTLETYGFVDIK